MRYVRYNSYREALSKPDSDADYNRRVDACADCRMGENYAELCSVHAKEAGWEPYGWGAMNWDGTITVTGGR